ncbi:MAG TPA: NAD(P)/FAD-dependent oxidoreductase [Candidatus Acidoferrum sp.]|jgi:flavin-dependent dehydrogenase|nr:NAD(P)/FAD-dependent oxidoreductase [Candidatus Acidoferrum sp.]
MKATAPQYDVAIVGGALSGAATALLLLRERPELKVLIVEKAPAFGRRVGEATVEVSGYFLCRVLGLTQHLNEAHLVKQGMRFWFFNSRTASLADCSEIGGRYLSRVPSFQVDRSVLDEEVLRRAKAAGAEVWRPASVGKIELMPGGLQTLNVKYNEEAKQVSARWVVDASGVAALLARQEGWWRPNTAHPTTAVWARWTGVKDWDGFELTKKYPDWAMACHGIRATATNHLVGPGWWAWIIPLKGGDVSIGAVFDQRLVDWPTEGPLAQRLKDFLAQHPVARELLAEAQAREGDVHWRKNLPYCSTTFAGDGFALVGDAAAFLDPFYSPGMDWISFTATSISELLLAHYRGAEVAPLIAEHNRAFARSYDRWFQALYQDKYEYMGEFDLMRLAFLLDLGFYYLGVASQPFKRGAKALTEPVFSTPPSVPFFYFIRAYNRRFAAIARARRSRQRWGRRNAGRRFLFRGYTFAPNSALPIAGAIAGWARLELSEGWRSWFRKPEVGTREPAVTGQTPKLSELQCTSTNRSH